MSSRFQGMEEVFKFSYPEYEYSKPDGETCLPELEETEWSLRHRIEVIFRFDATHIVPLEGETKTFEVGGFCYRYYSKINFSVNGYGYGTDFKDIWRDEAYDDEDIYKANHEGEER